MSYAFTLPMPSLGIRLQIRDPVDRNEGVIRWICIHEFVSTKENTNVYKDELGQHLTPR